MANEKTHLIEVIGLACIGVFAIVASIFNWNFFFENRKAWLILKLFGRNGARIFYSSLGFFILFLCYKIMTE